VTYHPPAGRPVSPRSRFDQHDRALPCPEGHWGHGSLMPWYHADGLDAIAADAGLADGLAVLEKVVPGLTRARLATASYDQVRAWADDCCAWAGAPAPGGRFDVVMYGSSGIFSHEAGWTS
jgi:hypothetical protein